MSSESVFDYDDVEVENEGIFELWDVDSVNEENETLIPIEIISDDEVSYSFSV